MPLLFLEVKVTDTTKYKSVGIDITTYNKLRKICDAEDRNIRQQISRWVNKEWREGNYQESHTSMGIGSVGQKNSV